MPSVQHNLPGRTGHFKLYACVSVGFGVDFSHQTICLQPDMVRHRNNIGGQSQAGWCLVDLWLAAFRNSRVGNIWTLIAMMEIKEQKQRKFQSLKHGL